MNLGHSLTESIRNGQGEAKFSTGTCSLRYCVWEHCPLMHRLMAWVQTQKNTRMANRSRSYSNWTPIHANWEGGPSDDMALWQFCRFPNRETIPRWNRHKRWVSILNSKNREEMSPQIQWLCMRLLRFDFTMSHVPGLRPHHGGHTVPSTFDGARWATLTEKWDYLTVVYSVLE